MEDASSSSTAARAQMAARAAFATICQSTALLIYCAQKLNNKSLGTLRTTDDSVVVDQPTFTDPAEERIDAANITVELVELLYPPS